MPGTLILDSFQLALPKLTFSLDPVLKLPRETSALFLYLCDLLCTILVQHSHRSQYFILSCGISAKIATLLRTRDKHMRLGEPSYHIHPCGS